jgi:dTDP-4-amino-4,6-dideoxygalactose transaminase
MTNIKVPFVDLSIQHKQIEKEIESVIKKTIAKGDFVLGEDVKQFELEFASVCGVKYAVGVGCGTDAIALGLKACGMGKGDEVILPTNTFIATLIGVIEAEAKPILVDCDRDTGLIDLVAAEKVISDKTKAIIPVHLYGQLVAPQKLLELANKYNIIIFEDSAQAHLASRDGYYAGSIGKAAGFSFYPSKNLGALGDGGIVVTNDEKIANKLRSLRNYGATQKYIHTEVGFNSRLDTLQAGILRLKLPYLKQWNQQRNLAAQKYDQLLSSLQEKDILPLKNVSGEGHIYHLYVIKIGKNCPVDREQMAQKLALMDIQTGIHYPIPCHLQSAYKYLGYKFGDFPVAENMADQILSLPMFPGITDEQINHVVNSIKSIVC